MPWIWPDGIIVPQIKGSRVPAGWKLCDGTRGTLDLRGKYLAACDTSIEVGKTNTYTQTPDSQGAIKKAVTATFVRVRFIEKDREGWAGRDDRLWGIRRDGSSPSSFHLLPDGLVVAWRGETIPHGWKQCARLVNDDEPPINVGRVVISTGGVFGNYSDEIPRRFGSYTFPLCLGGPANSLKLSQLTTDMDNAMTVGGASELVALPDTFLPSGSLVWSTRGLFPGTKEVSMFVTNPSHPTGPTTDDANIMFSADWVNKLSTVMELLDASKIPTAWQYIELGLAS